MRYFAADIDSFLYFYRFGRWALDDADPANVESLDRCVSRVEDLGAIDFSGIGLAVPREGMPGSLCPLVGESSKRHVLVGKNANTHSVRYISRRRWTDRIPPGSFVRVSPGVYLSTPGFTFLQLARKLTTTQLALVGCVMCARYHINSSGEIVQRDRQVTSVSELSSYLDGARGVRWVNTARKALRYVADRAESPQEINSFLLTCLPKDLGGCGVRDLKLNYVVFVEPEDLAILDRPERTSFRIDMGKPEAHAGSEYLGKQHELTADADRARLNALLAKGERLLQVKYSDLVDPVLSERHSNQLAALLGLDPIEMTPKQLVARDDLKAFLFGSERPLI